MRTRAPPAPMLRRLKQKRRFARCPVAADQHQRTFHHAAAQCVQLSNAGRCSRGCFLRHAERRMALAPCRAAADSADRRVCAACGACSSKVFHALQPGHLPISAGFHSRTRAAYIDCLFLCHARPPRYQRASRSAMCTVIHLPYYPSAKQAVEISEICVFFVLNAVRAYGIIKLHSISSVTISPQRGCTYTISIFYTKEGCLFRKRRFIPYFIC